MHVPEPTLWKGSRALPLLSSLHAHPRNDEVPKASDAIKSEWHRGSASEIMESLSKRRNHPKQPATPAMNERAVAVTIWKTESRCCCRRQRSEYTMKPRRLYECKNHLNSQGIGRAGVQNFSNPWTFRQHVNNELKAELFKWHLTEPSLSVFWHGMKTQNDNEQCANGSDTQSPNWNCSQQ